MNIKSKYVIVTIIATVGLFFTLDKIESKDSIGLKTIQGDVKELNGIELESYRSGYYNYISTINDGVIKTNKKYQKYNSSDIYPMDIKSGGDSIAYAAIDNGYYDENKPDNIKLILGESGTFENLEILPSQGNDEFMYPLDKDFKRSNETEIVLREGKKNKELNSSIWSSIRYNDKLYLALDYNGEKSKKYIEIICPNTKTKDYKVKKDIDVVEEFKKEYSNYNDVDSYINDLYVYKSYKKDNNFYFYAMSFKNESSENRAILIQYDLESDKVISSKIDIPNGYYVEDYNFNKNDELEINMSNRDVNDFDIKGKNITLKTVTYNIDTRKIIDSFDVLLEKNTKLNASSYIDHLINDEEKIYIKIGERGETSSLESSGIYVVDKKSKSIVYRGKIMSSRQFNMLKE